jgi:hypothetical protein
MVPYFKQVLNLTDTILTKLESQLHAKIRLAFVGYRDYGDKQKIETFDFAHKEDDIGWIIDYLLTLACEGGDDEAEDVIGGLEAVLKLGWQDDCHQVIIHCADSPGHGMHDGDSVVDRWPKGHPKDRKFEDVILDLKERLPNLYYYMYSINNSTNTMVRIMQLAGLPIHHKKMIKPNGLLADFGNSVAWSLSNSLGSGSEESS